MDRAKKLAMSKELLRVLVNYEDDETTSRPGPQLDYEIETRQKTPAFQATNAYGKR